MRSHGSGQACNKLGLTPSCAECRAYMRAAGTRRRRTPGSYAYMETRGFGRPGALKRLRDNASYRAAANDRDYKILEELKKIV